jgi:RHS repeat-associated protein
VRAGDELLEVMRPAPGGTWSTRYVHSDALGSVRSLTDETGTTTDTRAYEAFGTKNVHAGSDPLAYGFAGEPFEATSRLAYHRARWMDARVGRFFSVDTLDRSEDGADPFGIAHLYVYADSNPLNEADPTGQEPDMASISVSVNIAGINATLSIPSVLASAASIACAAQALGSAAGADPLPGGPCGLYRVRLQAQGSRQDPLEQSVPLGPRNIPFTVAEGVQALEQLKLMLNKDQLRDRTNPFRRAERYIRSGPPFGLNPPGLGFHAPPPLNRAIRVDVEIQAGTNFKQ